MVGSECQACRLRRGRRTAPGGRRVPSSPLLIGGSVRHGLRFLSPTSPPKERTGHMHRQTEKYCAVRGCRHAHTHVTLAHRCGRCHGYGHGVVECTLDLPVRRAYPERLPTDLRCTVPECPNPWTHTCEGHHCLTCGSREPCACAQAEPGQPQQSPPPSPRTTPRLSDPAAAPPSNLQLTTCPLCKVQGPVGHEVFTGAECLVCMEAGPCVVLTACRHAVVCRACAARL